mgnify:CR=1 FL=1
MYFEDTETYIFKVLFDEIPLNGINYAVSFEVVGSTIDLKTTLKGPLEDHQEGSFVAYIPRSFYKAVLDWNHRGSGVLCKESEYGTSARLQCYSCGVLFEEIFISGVFPIELPFEIDDIHGHFLCTFSVTDFRRNEDVRIRNEESLREELLSDL